MPPGGDPLSIVKPLVYNTFVNDIVNIKIDSVETNFLLEAEDAEGSPPTDKSETKFEMDVDLEGYINIENDKLDSDVYKNEITSKILSRKYIFNPNYYYQDSNRRLIYTIDNKIHLTLNFNIININFMALYYIMSLCQLLLLECIDKDFFERILELTVENINLKVKFMYNRRIFRMLKFVNNEKVRDVTLIVTSEEFETLVDSQISKLRVNVRIAPEKKFN